jgi:hypothetical protein
MTEDLGTLWEWIDWEEECLKRSIADGEEGLASVDF